LIEREREREREGERERCRAYVSALLTITSTNTNSLSLSLSLSHTHTHTHTQACKDTDRHAHGDAIMCLKPLSLLLSLLLIAKFSRSRPPCPLSQVNRSYGRSNVLAISWRDSGEQGKRGRVESDVCVCE
jgi:hypothetical protein